jgi:hypothetical protein
MRGASGIISQPHERLTNQERNCELVQTGVLVGGSIKQTNKNQQQERFEFLERAAIQIVSLDIEKFIEFNASNPFKFSFKQFWLFLLPAVF